jgi:N-acetylneuraminate 9-O-acetyltransferase
MVVAWAHPAIEAGWKRIDDLSARPRLAARASLVAASLAAGYAWYSKVYVLPKIEYNALHPYTSWIPLTLWIVVRNLTPALRSHSLGLFGWLGCITLETYIGQFHVWLRSNIPDGQPKWVLDVVRTPPPRPALAVVVSLLMMKSSLLAQSVAHCP